MSDEVTVAIRDTIREYGRLACDVSELTDSCSLYDAGLTSQGSVTLMLALEERFDIEFPDNLLNRKSFASIAAIEKTVGMILDNRKVA